MEPLEAARQEFSVSLQVVLDNSKFVNAAYKAAAQIELSPLRDLSDSTAKLVTDSLKFTSRAGENAGLEGAVIIFAAHFEFFVRNTIEAACDEIEIKVREFDNLGEKVKIAHAMASGEILAQPNRYRLMGAPFDIFEISRRLGSCVPGAQKYRLNAKAVSRNEINLNSGELGRLLSRIGCENVWDSLAKEQSLLQYFNVKKASLAKIKAIAALDDFIHLRNCIVHANLNHSPVGVNTLEIQRDFFNALSAAISSIVIAHCNAL